MKGEEAVRRLAAGEPDALDAVSAAYTPLLNYVIFAILEDKQGAGGVPGRRAPPGVAGTGTV